MTLIQIRYFLEICKYGTLSKAADQLFISQPALSGAMKDLEKQLGINIFRYSLSHPRSHRSKFSNRYNSFRKNP